MTNRQQREEFSSTPDRKFLQPILNPLSVGNQNRFERYGRFSFCNDSIVPLRMKIVRACWKKTVEIIYPGNRDVFHRVFVHFSLIFFGPIERFVFLRWLRKHIVHIERLCPVKTQRQAQNQEQDRTMHRFTREK